MRFDGTTATSLLQSTPTSFSQCKSNGKMIRGVPAAFRSGSSTEPVLRLVAHCSLLTSYAHIIAPLNKFLHNVSRHSNELTNETKTPRPRSDPRDRHHRK